ncbi:MAG: SRPBCC domain-containing protein [Pseudorhodoplanes sp.]|nr:SRPBCC domain-containing protein [Pseudorhodoplanes sp.]
MPAPQSLAAKPSLTLKRRLNARPEKAYAAWTQAAQLARWFGPEGTQDGSIRAELDVRAGGRFRVSFRTGDGEYHEVGGVYREVVPNERLAFTWAWHTTPERESVVTVTFKPDGEGTILTLHHAQFFDQPARDGHERGWTGALAKLARLLA